MQSLTLYADETIDTANRLVAAAAAGHCTLCDADGTPIGVTSSVPGPSGLVSGFALANDVFTLAASGSIAFGDAVELADDGYVAKYKGGKRIGRAVSEVDQGGNVNVAVSLSDILGPGPMQTRDAALVYTDGQMVVDSSGIYIGDGTTAGGAIMIARGSGEPPVDGAAEGAIWTDDSGEILVTRQWNGSSWE